MSKKKVLISILVISGFLIANLTYQHFFNKKENPNNEIHKEENNTNKNKLFAMYVNNGKGYEEYSGDELFPKGYYLNMEESYCRDDNGQKVENVLSSDLLSSVSLRTNQTVYCTLYFEKLDATLLKYNPEKSETNCVTVQCALDDLYKLLW